MIQHLRYIDPTLYIKTLFDPVQTHAVYGVFAEDVDRVKDVLREHGATRFRIVKPRDSRASTLRIVCYKIKS